MCAPDNLHDYLTSFILYDVDLLSIETVHNDIIRLILDEWFIQADRTGHYDVVCITTLCTPVVHLQLYVHLFAYIVYYLCRTH